MHQFTVTEFIIGLCIFSKNRIAKAMTLENVHGPARKKELELKLNWR